jgi:hypothetical protein
MSQGAVMSSRARRALGFGCGGCLILIVLAAIVLPPMLVPSREKDRQTSCLSNMRSLALCTLEYAADFDQRLPPRPAHLFNRTLAEGVGVGTDLSKLCPPDDWRRQIRYRNDQVFMCPSTRSMYSYEFNAQVYGLRLPEMTNTSGTIMEYDAGFVTGTPRGPHHEGYDVTFCDSHAKWLREYGTPGQTATLDGGSSHR